MGAMEAASTPEWGGTIADCCLVCPFISTRKDVSFLNYSTPEATANSRRRMMCSHVSRSVERYLRWLGVKTEGEYLSVSS